MAKRKLYSNVKSNLRLRRNRSLSLTGFTLIEVIMSVSLVAVLGLVVYGTLNSGVRIWQRANTTNLGEDINIFFEKIAVDLRNSFSYKNIDFIGTEESLQFATLVATHSKIAGLKRGVGEISYIFDAESHVVLKRKRNLSNIFKQEQGFSQEVLKSLESCIFKYYFYDSLEDKFYWLEEWEAGKGTPLAVSITLEVKHGEEKRTFTKAVIIPVRS